MCPAEPGGERESSIRSGWTVQPEADTAEDEIAADAEVAADVKVAADPKSGDEANSDEAASAAVDDSAPDEQLSNVALVLLGVVGGLYLVYAWIWMSWAQALASSYETLAATNGAVGAVLQLIVYWSAPLAPILWFLAALALNRRRGFGRIMLWIGIGAVLLVPYPFFVVSGGS